MKKKLIATHILALFLSLLTLLLITLFLLDHYQKKDAERSLWNHLAIATSYYDEGSSAEQTKNLLANSYSDIRLTILNANGDVLVDSSGEVLTNHADRPEIQNPGKVFYRYSTTLKENRIYLCGVDTSVRHQGDYIRVSLSLAEVERNVYAVAGYGSLGIVTITALGGLLTAYVVAKEMRPLKQEVAALSDAVGEASSDKDDVKELGARIDKARSLLNERYEEVRIEQRKYEELLDGMEQGLVALDSKGIAQIVNRAGAESFRTSKEKALGQNYRFFSLDERFLLAVEKALSQGEASAMDLSKEGRIYLLNFSPLAESFSHESGRYGVAILSLDVTEKRKLEETKRDFFANASHELKTPLTAIIGYQELMQNGALLNDNEKIEATETTLKEARRMKDIIAQMLILSKLEGGAKKKCVPLVVGASVKEALDEYQGLIDRLHLRVETSLAEVTLTIDPEDLRNLVFNLIENAAKYNKEKGLISIVLTPSSLVVKDTGIGIAPENLSRVFERFYRVDIDRSNALGGTGLGLSIVKHICLDYGYALHLESTLGLGSTFTIDFPPKN